MYSKGAVEYQAIILLKKTATSLFYFKLLIQLQAGGVFFRSSWL